MTGLGSDSLEGQHERRHGRRRPAAGFLTREDVYASPTERTRKHHPHRFGRATRLLLHSPAHLYDWHLGWLLNGRFLRLTHLGRRSGRRYQTVLEVVGSDRGTGEIMVMSGFGRSADWFRNLQAATAVEIAIGRRRFRPQHRILDETEAAGVLADYERRNRLIAPIVRLALGWLVGWRYDGSDAARTRLLRQLPMVAFQPITVCDVSCVR
jgi:deazaflavin-dependent oxidoreductase (nitroreductase family)